MRSLSRLTALMLVAALVMPAPALAWTRTVLGGWTRLLCDPAGGWSSGNPTNNAAGVSKPYLWDPARGQVIWLPGSGSWGYNGTVSVNGASGALSPPGGSAIWNVTVPAVADGTTWCGIVDFYQVVTSQDPGWLVHFVDGNARVFAQLDAGAARVAQATFVVGSWVDYPYTPAAQGVMQPFTATASVWKTDVWIAVKRVGSVYSWTVFTCSFVVGARDHAKWESVVGTSSSLGLGAGTSYINQRLPNSIQHFNAGSGQQAVTIPGDGAIVKDQLYSAGTTDTAVYDILSEAVAAYRGGTRDPYAELVPPPWGGGTVPPSGPPTIPPVPTTVPGTPTVTTPSVLPTSPADIPGAFNVIWERIQPMLEKFTDFFWFVPYFKADPAEAGW